MTFKFLRRPRAASASSFGNGPRSSFRPHHCWSRGGLLAVIDIGVACDLGQRPSFVKLTTSGFLPRKVGGQFCFVRSLSCSSPGWRADRVMGRARRTVAGRLRRGRTGRPLQTSPLAGSAFHVSLSTWRLRIGFRTLYGPCAPDFAVDRSRVVTGSYNWHLVASRRRRFPAYF